MEQFFHRMHVRKETIRRQTKAIKDQWKRDESEGFPGSCEFKVKYLGYTEVYESKGADICRQSFQRLKYDDLGISLTHIFQKSRRRLPSLSGQPLAKFHISSDGIRITDEDENIIVETPISSVTFCCPNSQHERGFTFICRGDVPWKWHCHAVEAADDHGERLNNAVGCAFTICLEKKMLSKRQNAAGSFTATDEHQDGTGRPFGEIRRLSIADLQAPQPPASNGSDLFPRNISDSTMNRSIDRPRAPLEMRNRKGSLGNMMEAHPYKRRFHKDNVPEEEMELRDTSDEQPTFF